MGILKLLWWSNRSRWCCLLDLRCRKRWRCRRKLNWRLLLIWRHKEILESALKFWRKVDRELARFNPIVLEFWKRVLLPSDESVDLLLVKLAPEMLFLLRELTEMEMFTAQKL
jgi:hypothetical protein